MQNSSYTLVYETVSRDNKLNNIFKASTIEQSGFLFPLNVNLHVLEHTDTTAVSPIHKLMHK